MEEELSRLRKTPKRPKFRPNGMQPRNRNNSLPPSSGQVNHILLNEADEYSRVSEEILTAGLQEAPYLRTDDTGDKHEHKNGYCTHIGGEYFAYYKTTFSKSRENFLRIILQGKEGYYINEAMIWHLFQ